ncbi:HAAS domain-containing protein [Cohnella sp. REN36]|uniref:HAAS signaling domain-containing protein n=1 Tax=Cohnella sp. REN36 TaxID=2887347 RepID=UPI001D14A499|nr:DUF1700 domain-containing protein [Cohnella sp. REN36]MCC3373593.1 DUF1700 domain-containing protein [Cohnella sp. REN36]
MDKRDYLLRLEAGLKRLPESERQDIISDFEEHYATGLEKGLSEQEISRKLGDPGTIAKELVAEYRIAAAERDRSFSSAVRAVTATTGIGIGAVVGLFPVLAAICGFLLLCVVPILFILSPLTLLRTMPFYDRTDVLLYLFLSITTFSLGVLMGAGLYSAGRKLAGWALSLTKSQLESVKGDQR